jgi:hypothetical protein
MNSRNSLNRLYLEHQLTFRKKIDPVTDIG